MKCSKIIKKSKLFVKINKLKRQVFIWENIGIGINSSIKEKEKMWFESHKNGH